MPGKYEQFINFLTNPIFLSGLFSWLGAQLLKTFINLLYGRIKSLKQLFEYMVWKTGGMPSSHSALVTSVTTAIGFNDGINSSVFMVSMIVTFITIRDAVGVRRSSGMQAHKLNDIGKELESKNVIEEYKPIKEVDGHTPMQVILGALLGFLIGLSMSLLK